MKKIISLLGFLGFCLTIKAQSPISITSANMPISGDTARYSNASLNALGDYTITGANYNWDFTYLDSTGQEIRKFQPSTATPYYFYFFPPKYGEKILDSIPLPSQVPFTIKNIYSFYRKNSTLSFNSEGLGLTMSGIPIGATYSNEDELYLFPLNYQDRDSTTFKLSTPSNTMIPFTYKKEGYRITEVDGWGTITTHYGTAPCLRIVTTQYSQDTITISALPPGFNKFGFPNYMRSYQWLTLTEKIPYLEINGTLNGTIFNPTQARYRDVLRYFTGIKAESVALVHSIFPNPSTQELTIITNQQNQAILVELQDLQGKTLLTRVFDRNSSLINKQTLDVSGLAKGLYMLNLTSGNKKQSLKISIQ